MIGAQTSRQPKHYRSKLYHRPPLDEIGTLIKQLGALHPPPNSIAHCVICDSIDLFRSKEGERDAGKIYVEPVSGKKVEDNGIKLELLGEIDPTSRVPHLHIHVEDSKEAIFPRTTSQMLGTSYQRKTNSRGTHIGKHIPSWKAPYVRI